jgi:hypothetical protein
MKNRLALLLIRRDGILRIGAEGIVMHKSRFARPIAVGYHDVCHFS